MRSYSSITLPLFLVRKYENRLPGILHSQKKGKIVKVLKKRVLQRRWLQLLLNCDKFDCMTQSNSEKWRIQFHE